MGDIDMRERVILIPIVVMMLWMGVYSAPFLRRMDASLEAVQKRVHNAAPAGGYHVRLQTGPGSAGGTGR
jgi:NADH-quinone oxidoreductase subunit M